MASLALPREERSEGIAYRSYALLLKIKRYTGATNRSRYRSKSYIDPFIPEMLVTMSSDVGRIERIRDHFTDHQDGAY